MPGELAWLSNAISNLSLDICDYFLGFCSK